MTLLENGFAPPEDPDEVLASYSIVFDYLAVAHRIERSDVIVCFGSLDPMVPVRAAELHADGAAPVVVTTGGVAHVDGRPEAEVLAEQLIGLGVPPEAVIVERRSRHTEENVVFAMRALEAAGKPANSMISVAWPFAARRCVSTIARHHPDVKVSSAPAFDVPGQRSPLSAATVRWALEQFDRVVDYQARGWVRDHPTPTDVLAAADVLRQSQ